MARADSVIRVSIIGDAKKLVGALQTANAETGGLLASAAKGFAAFQIVDKGFEAIGSILDNADRAGDALSRIVQTIGQADADKLDRVAGDFSQIGISAPDFLEIAAGFADFATASGKLDADQITAMAPAVAEFAGAMARLKNADPAAMGEAVSNFITGTRGGAAAGKELGILFDPSVTAAERYEQVLLRLPGAVDAVTGANAGLDDKQANLNAKWETFGSEIGPTVEGVLERLLDELIPIPDNIQAASDGFGMLGDAIVRGANHAIGPLSNILGTLQDIVALLPFVGGSSVAGANVFNRPRESDTVRNQQDHDERNGNTRTASNRIGGP